MKTPVAQSSTSLTTSARTIFQALEPGLDSANHRLRWLTLLLALLIMGFPVAAQAQSNSTESPEAGTTDPKADDEDQDEEEETDEDDDDLAGDPVDLQAGAFLYHTPGLSIPGRGIPFELDFSYRSDRISIPTTTGTRWTHSYEQKLVLERKVSYIPIWQGPGQPSGGGLGQVGSEGDPEDYLEVVTYSLYHYHDLRIDRYFEDQDDPGLWLPGRGLFRKVVWQGNGQTPTALVMRGADGTTVTFGLSETLDCPTLVPQTTVTTYRPTMIEDAAQNRITMQYEFIPSLGCTGVGHHRLARVLDTFGRAVDFAYDATGWLETVTDFTGRQVQLEHDAIGNLTALTTPAVGAVPSRTEFQYDPKVFGQIDSGHNIVAIIAPNEINDASRVPYLQNTYDSANERVIRQVMGGINGSGVPAGGTLDFLYDVQTTPIDHGWFKEQSRTAVIDPNGNVSLAIYDDHDRKRLFYRFAGRVPHVDLSAPVPITIDDLITVEPSVWPPNLANNHLVAPSEPAKASHLSSLPSSIRRQDYNEDNLLTLDESQDFRMEFVYDDGSDLFQHLNLLVRRQVSSDDPTDVIETAYAYEPLYNQVRAAYDSRGLSTFTPPNGGANGPDRYGSFKIFDYQEGPQSAVQGLIDYWRIDVDQADALAKLAVVGVAQSSIAFDLGDAAGNADGRVDQFFGSLVRAESMVHLFDDPIANTFAQTAVVELYRHNDYAQSIETVDAAGVSSRTEYYPANDPTGSGGMPAANGGGLRAAFEAAYGAPESGRWELGYDILGRLTTVTNPRGFTQSRTYGEMDELISEVDERGYQKTYSYDGNLNLAETRFDVKQPAVNAAWMPTFGEQLIGQVRTTFVHDILGRVVRKDRHVPDEGQVLSTRHRYDRAGNHVLTLSAEWGNEPGALVSRVYDEFQRPWTDSVGGVTAEFVSSLANADIPELASLPVDPMGLSTKKTFYDGTQPTIRRDEGGSDTTLVYDGFNRMITSIDPIGNWSTTTYGPSGLVESQISYDGNSGDKLTEARILRDELGRDFQIDRWFADASGSLQQDGPLSSGDGFVTLRRKYDVRGNVTMEVDDLLRTSTYQYDGRNRVIRCTDSLGNYSTYQYDPVGNLIYEEQHELDPNSVEEVYGQWRFHDQLDRWFATADSLGQADYRFYDSRGNVVVTTDAKSGGTMPMSIIDIYGQHADLSGAPDVNGLGNTALRLYDLAGRLTQTRKVLRVGGMGGNAVDSSQAGDGFIDVRHEYDLNGRLITSYDDENHPTSYEYDSHGRLTRTTYADGTQETKTWYPTSMVKRSTDANGVPVDFTYDGKHRVQRKDVGGGGPGTTFEEYGWDALDRMISATNDFSVVTREYDSMGNMTRETQNGQALIQTHDPIGNALTCTYPGGRVVHRTFDTLHRLEHIEDGLGAAIVDYQYVGPERVFSRTQGNGVVHTPLYDGARRIRETLHAKGAAEIHRQTYQRDRTDHKIARTNQLTGLAHTYTYDSSYRMTSDQRSGGGFPVETVALDYDGVGNRASVHGGAAAGSYSQDASDDPVNQYTATPGVVLEHDDNGNLLIRRDDQTSAVLEQFTYDYRNQLIEYTDGGGEVHQYDYDALGRRIRKTRDVFGAGVVENYFYAPGERLCEVQSAVGSTLVTVVYGRALIEPVEFRFHFGPGTSYYYHGDDMHNVVAITDATGGVVETFEYGEFGQLLDPATLAPLTGSSTGSPFFFGGHMLDSESGLYWMRHRFMDPVVGRFITRDPKGIWSDPLHGGNGYTYANNNPWTYADPFGTETWENIRDLPEEGVKWGRGLQEIADGVEQAKPWYDGAKKVLTEGAKGAFEVAAGVLTGGLSEIVTDKYDLIAENIHEYTDSALDVVTAVGSAGGLEGFPVMKKDGEPVAPGEIVHDEQDGFDLKADPETGVVSGTATAEGAGPDQVYAQEMGMEGYNEYLHFSIELEDGTEFQVNVNSDGSKDYKIMHEDRSGVIARFTVDKDGNITKNTLSRRKVNELNRLARKKLRRDKVEKERLKQNADSRDPEKNKGDTKSSKTHKAECLKGNTEHWGSASGNPRPSDSGGGGDSGGGSGGD